MTSSYARMGALLALVSLLILPANPLLGQDAAPAGPPVTGEQAFPTGNPNTSILLIQHRGPAAMRAGVPFTYEVHLRNLTDAALPEMEITEELPNGFKASSLEPNPDSSNDRTAAWTLNQLGPRAVAVIRISGVSDNAGELSYCTSVAFKTRMCSAMRIVEPALKLTKTAPSEVIVCDVIPINLVVSNTGTGAVDGVEVTDMLPDGWRTADGKDTVSFDAGTLRPGQSREFSFQVKSADTGRFVNEATATEPGGLTAEASAETVVRAPALAVTKTGPEMRYIGRPAEYEITVSNTGDAPARDTVLVDTASGVGEFVGASDNGRFADGTVRWTLGTLDAGASRTVKVSFVGQRAGSIRNEAVATAYCAEAWASASTEVRGVAAILLETIDEADPIEVEAEEIYTITVTNQGTANDENIRIECTLPPEMDFVDAEGPTKFKVEGKTVTFEPLPSLAPKARAVYRVKTKGTAPADVRFKTSLTSDMLTSPVQETESTHIY